MSAIWTDETYGYVILGENFSDRDRDGESKYKELIPSIPLLKFPSDWEVKIIHPFGGATIRFIAVCNNKEISVFLDHFNNLSALPTEPYWEIYCYDDNEDIQRFNINDVEGMFKAMNDYFYDET